MRGDGQATYTPDDARASLATTTASEREAAARGLQITDAARLAATHALLVTADTTDGRDTGSEAASDAARAAAAALRTDRHGPRARAAGSVPPALDARDGRTGGGDRAPDADRTADAPKAEKGANAAEATKATDAADAAGTTRDARVGEVSDAAARTGHAGPSPSTRGTRDQRAGTRRPAERRTATQARTVAHGTGRGTRGGTRNQPEAHAGHPGARDVTPHPAPAGTSPDAVAAAGTTPAGTGLPRLGRPRPGMGRTDGPGGRPGLRTNRGLGAARPSTRVAPARVSAAPRAARATGAAVRAPATTAALAAAIACGVLLWATLMLLLSMLAGGAADQDRTDGARLVAEAAEAACREGEDDGRYHWKGERFRAYVGGIAPGGAWDAAFVSWCMGEAGFVGSGLVGRYATVTSYLARFTYDEEAGRAHGTSEKDYVPKVGDLLVLWAGTQYARIEVVTAVSADGLTVTTVSGDAPGGEAGSYDRDADGWGGYVSRREREAHDLGTTYLAPSYSADAASAART